MKWRQMKDIYTVSQVNGYIKNMFVKDMLLNRISIKGEVSNCKYHTSGHIYFTLKDAMGQMACVMFAGQRAGLSFRMREGDGVIVSGKVDVFERDGKYQLYAQEIRLDGVGQLYERLEQRKAKLNEQGLFDKSHKLSIPPFPKKIGIVTAGTGAALQDIRNIAARRNPYVQLVLAPVQVQGFGAAESVARGIRRLDKYGVDIIIVARGGGSIEDLWAFNEECVVRAAYACATPLISGVGHETDVTLIDYVADLRAPTPSAAAELAVYEIQALDEALAGCHAQLTRQMLDVLEAYRERVQGKKDRLFLLSPQRRFAEKRERTGQFRMALSRRMAEILKEKRGCFAGADGRLSDRMEAVLERKRSRLALCAARLKGISPLERIGQGYAYVAVRGKHVTSVHDVKTGDEMMISVRDGDVYAHVSRAVERKV